MHLPFHPNVKPHNRRNSLLSGCREAHDSDNERDGADSMSLATAIIDLTMGVIVCRLKVRHSAPASLRLRRNAAGLAPPAQPNSLGAELYSATATEPGSVLRDVDDCCCDSSGQPVQIKQSRLSAASAANFNRIVPPVPLRKPVHPLTLPHHVVYQSGVRCKIKAGIRRDFSKLGRMLRQSLDGSASLIFKDASKTCGETIRARDPTWHPINPLSRWRRPSWYFNPGSCRKGFLFKLNNRSPDNSGTSDEVHIFVKEPPAVGRRNYPRPSCPIVGTR